jgi:hypothetical protein
VMWLLKGLDGTATPAELVAALQAETATPGAGSSGADLLPLMTRAVKDLYQRGFLVKPR